ncbi:CAAX amino terminal protease self-immunity [Legionella massiliensis]|uniref:CAAX amino terminal protease self-immunity n=1 Tax=Legionella massiliensis TaxID=1034943 RepID=A0A078KVT9_9GAMM|nr:CPBP family glutamic-type intramembrane protease [Legionella massiliensis]CDZ75823.1 CAAX amino terminal protease self-immunity [Legionella massiliensis]CEE11561.1 CAAX amino terminal protease self-immunity [Legionella massiliensis]
MQLNWPLIIVLFGLCLPGVFIVVPRLIKLLLPDNSEELRRRVTRLAVAQTLVMVFMMSLAGAALSLRTGLSATLLEALLQGQPIFGLIQQTMIPAILYTLGGLVIFLVLYYGIVESILDDKTSLALKKIRATLGPDGCVLYGGVVEEVLARWGLLNVIAFFAILFAKQKTDLVIWMSIFLSGILYAIGQLPAYLSAGCQPTRRLIYSLLLLTLWQAILFGWLFWQYGLVAAIVSHMLFHMGWALYDKPSSELK